MSDRLNILKSTLGQLHSYTTMKPWRPSLMDLWVYSTLINMHESDYDNGTSIPDFIWRKSPDEIMEHIIDSSRIFDMEYGWDSFDEDIRNYLIMNDFIVDPLDTEQVSDEEYKTNLENA